MTVKKQTITQKIIERERLLPAIRYTSKRVMAFFALLGINVLAGFRSVGTRMCQTLFPFVLNGVALLKGNRGTSGATTLWKTYLGLNPCELSDTERENELLALLIARAMPNERQFMGAYMLDGLSSAELTSVCVDTFGDKEGKAFVKIVKATVAFLTVSSEIVQADIKKKSGTTQHLGKSASGAIAEARQAQAQALLAEATAE